MDRSEIYRKYSSTRGRKQLATDSVAQSQAVGEVWLALAASQWAIGWKQPSCGISLAQYTVGGGDTS
ncbi:MAG: hypothetical protein MUE44_30950 [Oscillatoriaceae cyanobacterium Prado104]|nr:hypothetical protein [Oscillatoriaceae cyanobacterium Prado104]